MFWAGRHKGPLTILDVEAFQNHWYVVYPASKQLSVVKHFSEYLLAEGKQIAEQTTLEVMQDIVDPGELGMRFNSVA